MNPGLGEEAGQTARGLIDALKAQPAARVVLMTAYGYDPSHSIVNCRREGLQHILYKPFRVDQLLEALRDVKRSD